MTDTSSLLLPNAIVADLSHWNGSLTEADFETAIREGNLVGVVVKLMQAGRIDQTAASLLYAAYEAGIRCLGTYDFGTAEDDAQAYYNAILAEFQGKAAGVLVALDLERNPTSQMSPASGGHFAEVIHDELGRYPTLYMGRFGPLNNRVGLPDASLSKCDLWLPGYGPHASTLGDILPPGFTLPQSDSQRGGTLRMWQFSDGALNGGPMPGLGKCDQSQVLFSSRDALAAWWGA